jgi:sugar transferase (PEP-CTERM/EpsH1 system associated)
MKLAVLLSRFPYPLEKGDKLRAFHQIKELSKNHEIYLICLTDQKIHETWRNEVQKYCKELHVFKLNFFFIYLNTFKQLFTDKPFQTGYFYSTPIKRKIDQLLNTIKPDHIYCQLIRTAEYVKNIHDIPKTIDYMDALGKGMHRRAEISSGIRKYLFQVEGRRLTAYENRIFDYFNHHTIISVQDKKLIQHPQQDKIHVIENGIGDEFLDYHKESKKKYDLVFIGNLNYAPNVECAEFIVNQILPLLSTKKEIQVLICGANPGSRVQKLAKKNVEIQGWVEDIRTSYVSGKIFLAPLFIGTGLQNKLLEAMALGLPCITTPLANNALGAKRDESILLAETAQEFSDKIVYLLEKESIAQLIANAGRSYVKAHFSWQQSAEKLERVFQSSQKR